MKDKKLTLLFLRSVLVLIKLKKLILVWKAFQERGLLGGHLLHYRLVNRTIRLIQALGSNLIVGFELF